MKKKLPKTMTEVRMILSEKERQKIFKWLSKERNVKDLEIELDLSHHFAGYLGTVICKGVRWTNNRLNP